MFSIFGFKETGKDRKKDSFNREDISSKIQEVQDFMRKISEEKIKPKKKGDFSSLVDYLGDFVGYFMNIQRKLEDELVFVNRNLRRYRMQIKKSEKKLDALKSELEEKVRERDKILDEYKIVEEKYIQFSQKGFKGIEKKEDFLKGYLQLKRKKEEAESEVRSLSLIYDDTNLALRVLRANLAQNEMNVSQSEELLNRVSGVVEGLNEIYPNLVSILQGREEEIVSKFMKQLPVHLSQKQQAKKKKNKTNSGSNKSGLIVAIERGFYPLISDGKDKLNFIFGGWGRLSGNIINALCVYDGELFYSYGCDIINATSGEVVASRSGKVRTLCLYQDKLYDAGDYGKVLETFSGKVLASRPEKIRALCVYDNTLLDAGNYQRIFDTLNDPSGENPLWTFNINVTAMASLPIGLLKEFPFIDPDLNDTYRI